MAPKDLVGNYVLRIGIGRVEKTLSKNELQERQRS